MVLSPDLRLHLSSSATIRGCPFGGQSAYHFNEPRHPNERRSSSNLSARDSVVPALQTVLASASEYDVVWNLGDIVGYGANPNQVVYLARRLGGTIVRGNHDRVYRGIMDYSKLRDFSSLASASVAWTQDVLTKENTQWLAQLRRGPVWLIRRRVQCVHEAPNDEDEYIFFREDARSAMDRSRTRIVFFGHTHWQVGWSLRGQELTPIKPEYQSSLGAEQY
jgi:calcineurin-like phosphoesterase family protein